MTTGPTDVKVTTTAGGPGGIPLALRLNEGLGVFTRGRAVPSISCRLDSIPTAILGR